MKIDKGTFILYFRLLTITLVLLLTACASAPTKQEVWSTQSLNKTKQLTEQLILGKWYLTSSTKLNGRDGLAPTIDKYKFQTGNEVLMIDTLNRFNIRGEYELLDHNTITISFPNPRNKDKQITQTLKLYVTPETNGNKLELLLQDNVFTYLPSAAFNTQTLAGLWQGNIPQPNDEKSFYQLVLDEKGYADAFINGKRAHYGYFRYVENTKILYLSNQVPGHGNFGIRSYLVNEKNENTIKLSPIIRGEVQEKYGFVLEKVELNEKLESQLWWLYKKAPAKKLPTNNQNIRHEI